MDNCSKDIISSLPEALICHILFFLSTKEAARTSVLSKKWRYLFAFVSKLDLYDWTFPCWDEEGFIIREETRKTFMDFVDRVLALQGDSSVNEVNLCFGDGVDPVYVSRWILNVLKRGVLDFKLSITPYFDYVLHLEAFVSKTLVHLSIKGFGGNLNFVVEDAFLPNLKKLYIDSVVLGNSDDFFNKLIAGCHVLEELGLTNVPSDNSSCSIASKTLKILFLHWEFHDRSLDSVSFDTPNLGCLVYCDYVANRYPKMKFDSLVVAHIGLHMPNDQRAHASNGDLVSSATTFLKGIRDVQALHLPSYTLEVITLCRDSIPVFNKLNHLTIDTDQEVGWESLPALLKSCPNLETLVFEGLYHKRTSKCQEGCLCKSSKEIPTCLSSSPVKVLIIKRFGEITFYADDLREQMDQVKHFMETMPNLKQIRLDYAIVCKEEEVTELSKELQMLPKASPNCSVYVSSCKIIG